KLLGIAELPNRRRDEAPNPIVGAYRTADGRGLRLVMLQSDRCWGRLCELLGRPELAADPRFADAKARATNNAACIAELDAEFATRTLDECVALLDEQEGPWAVHRLPGEIFDDEQVHANGYVRTVKAGDGTDFDLVANPVQFYEEAPYLVRAPVLGART